MRCAVVAERQAPLSVFNALILTAGVLAGASWAASNAWSVESYDLSYYADTEATFAGPEPTDDADCDCADAAPPAALPAYGGCLCCRPKLTGDWCGRRDCLAQSGITIDFDETEFYQGVAAGGLDQRFLYSGHGDLLLNADFGKLGVQEGLFLKMRAEHRYGETVNRDTGAYTPVALLPALPTPDSEQVCLTDVLFTQALSEKFALFAGKMDTLDGDTNAFASGRGKDQFLNMAFVFNPIAARVIPYSTLGAGFVILRDLQPLFTFSVLNSTNTIDTSGFDVLFEEGCVLAGELRLPTTFFDRPGHQLFGFAWSSRTFTALEQDPRVIIPGGPVPIATQDGSWSLHWNFDQYLFVDPCDSTRGWGVFGRAGVSDANPNPLAYFLSFGIGGNSPIAGRGADRFGVGWYYNWTSTEIGPIVTQVLNLGDGQGVELFYNIEVTPWFHLTPDLQIIDPARQDIDTAYVAGLRARIDF